MLLLGNWIALIVFWLYIFRLTRIIGYKLPGCFAALWIIGYFGLPALGLVGGLHFITFESILAVILILLYLYKTQFNTENPLTLPEEEP